MWIRAHFYSWSWWCGMMWDCAKVSRLSNLDIKAMTMTRCVKIAIWGKFDSSDPFLKKHKHWGGNYSKVVSVQSVAVCGTVRSMKGSAKTRHCKMSCWCWALWKHSIVRWPALTWGTCACENVEIAICVNMVSTHEARHHNMVTVGH